MEQRDVASCCYHIEDHAALYCSTPLQAASLSLTCLRLALSCGPAWWPWCPWCRSWSRAPAGSNESPGGSPASDETPSDLKRGESYYDWFSATVQICQQAWKSGEECTPLLISSVMFGFVSTRSFDMSLSIYLLQYTSRMRARIF